MAAAKRKKRSGAKIATKKEQGDLLAHIERLADDPRVLVPTTDGPVGALGRLEKRLRKIGAAKGKRRALRWHLRFGPAFTRAFANLMLVLESGKANRMGSFRTPQGELKYAVRGNVSPRHVVAIQHFRYPEVRILGYRELARELKGVIWATEEGVHLTGRGAPAPQAWFDLLDSRLPVAFARDGTTVRCPHMQDVEDVTAPSAPFGLDIQIVAGQVRWLVCEACIRDHFSGRARGLLSQAAMIMIGLNAERDVVVQPTGTPTTCAHDGSCAYADHRPDIGKKTREVYITGALNEGKLIEHIGPRWDDAVRDARARVLVAGGTCYADDRAPFLDALGVTDATAEALGRFLDRTKGPVVADEASVNKVLDACWDVAPEVLAELHPDTEALDALLAKHGRSPKGMILEEVLEARQASTALAGYPTYSDLQGGAAAADAVARAYKVNGMEGLVAACDRELKRSTHKGVIQAALRIADALPGRDWHFQRTDTEAGEFLEAPMRKLLDAGPGAYHEALAEVHTLSGGSGELRKPRA